MWYIKHADASSPTVCIFMCMSRSRADERRSEVFFPHMIQTCFWVGADREQQGQVTSRGLHFTEHTRVLYRQEEPCMNRTNTFLLDFTSNSIPKVSLFIGIAQEITQDSKSALGILICHKVSQDGVIH